jgi:hypothetical protein
MKMEKLYSECFLQIFFRMRSITVHFIFQHAPHAEIAQVQILSTKRLNPLCINLSPKTLSKHGIKLFIVLKNTVRACNVLVGIYGLGEKMGVLILVALVAHCSHPNITTALNGPIVSAIEHYLHSGNIYVLKAQRHECRFTD